MSMRFLIFALCAAAMPSAAQDDVDGFVARTYESKGGAAMPYRLFVPPGYQSSKKYPLIIWLHGAGGIGSDNLRQISDDQVPGTYLWTRQEPVMRHPAFVVVPQSSGRWPDVHLSMVLEIVDSIRSEFGIDNSRVYLVGQSIGAAAAWKVLADHPRIFAAAIFVCSISGLPKVEKSITTTPVWAFQGSDDEPGVTATREMMKTLRSLGGKPRYTEYKGMGHEIWNRVFKEPALADWLFAQHTRS